MGLDNLEQRPHEFQPRAAYHPVEPDAVLPPGIELRGRGSLGVGVDVLPGTPGWH